MEAWPDGRDAATESTCVVATLGKPQRQHRISRLLEEQAISSQAQLVEMLAAHGVIATQATVSRDLEELPRSAVLHVFFGEEDREVFADDFVRAIALRLLCAAVPGRDVAVGVQHVHRVVLDVFDERAIALFTRRERISERRLRLELPHR